MSLNLAKKKVRSADFAFRPTLLQIKTQFTISTDARNSTQRNLQINAVIYNPETGSCRKIQKKTI